ncbi:MAG TPA: alpha-L-arabinofuranosidase C-terminal domain-containing protein [Verrucomicrobiae bacterium]
MINLFAVAILGLMILCGRSVAADTNSLTIHVDQPGIKINPMIFGLMTEEINHSYDGGLYAEMIANRNFKEGPALFTTGPIANHWSLVTNGSAQASITLDDNDPVNTNALILSLRLDVAKADSRDLAGIANEGYWGIAIRPNTEYHVSFYARSDRQFRGPLRVDIETADGSQVIVSGKIKSIGSEWKKFELTLKTSSKVVPSEKNRFVISASHPGSIWFSLVSCFPPTYNERTNGNRQDLMKLLVDLHPSFLRFPGGNGLEGRDLADRFAWKETIHGIEDRPGRWAPSRYYSNNGLGLLEFLEWCEDMKAEPILAVFAGYCVGGNGIHSSLVQPGSDLEPYVQEALDEVEYVTGDAKTTKWGAERAQDGHPEPFKLHYVEIGNEDGFDHSGSYGQRFVQFQTAFKAKYPDLQLIASTRLQTRTPDVQDDHFYQTPHAMARNSHLFDTTPRDGIKIFVGEWASKQGKLLTPNLSQALGDAAFMTGLERNSDVIIGACYAPLFANVNPITPSFLSGGSTWTTDMIGYDALTAFGSPSYYAQKMFYNNRADTSLPVDVPAGLYAAAGRMDASGDVVLKVVNTTSEIRSLQMHLLGMRNVSTAASGELLTGNPDDTNSVEEPMKVAPAPIVITNVAPDFTHSFPGFSISVIQFKQNER